MISKTGLRTNTTQSLSFKSSIIALSKAVGALLSLVISMFLSRYLSITSYGYYKEILLVYNTFVPILTLGIPTSINYFVPRSQSKEESKSYVYQSYLILSILGMFLTVFMFFGAKFLSVNIFHTEALIQLFKIFSPIPVLSMPTLFYINLLICEDKTMLAAKLSLVFAMIRFIFILLVIFIFHAGLFLIILSILLYSAIQFVAVTILYVDLYGKISFVLNRTLLRSQLSYAIPIAATSIIGILTAQTDKFMVSYFFNPAKYAMYANGAIEVPFVGIITGSINAVILPEFVKRWKLKEVDKMFTLWWNAIRKTGSILIPLMFFLLLYSKELLILLFSSKYELSASIFSIYLLKLPLRITIFGSILLAMGLSKAVFRYATYTLILNIVFNYLFIKLVGFKGPAIATVIVTYFIGVIQLIRISKETGRHLFDIFPYFNLLVILITSGILTFILSVIKPYFDSVSMLFSFSASFILYYIVLFFALLKLNIITKADLRFLKSFFIRR